MAKIGRNDPCACGSGKKFKQCCELKSSGAAGSRMMLVLVAAVILAAIIAVVSNARSGSGSGGRVWSPEHGHYHDANGREVPR